MGEFKLSLISTKVKHNTLGVGTIIYINSVTKVINVKFDKVYTFAYPICFERDLEILDKNLNDKFNTEKHKNTAAFYEQDFNSIKQEKVKAVNFRNISVLTKLEADLSVAFGGNSKTIYEQCSGVFDWKKNLSNKFGAMKQMFADDATPEHYGVKFIAFSNYTKDMDNKHWINRFNNNQDILYELWNNNDTIGKEVEMIVFVKASNGQYAFIGTYKSEQVIKINYERQQRRLRIYKRISKIYPM